MVESYRLVGNEPTWINAFMPIPAIFVFGFMRWRRGKTPYFTWQTGVIALSFLALSILDTPMEWIIGGACLSFGIALMFSKPMPMSLVLRGSTALLFAGLAAMFISMPLSMMNARIDLRSDHVDFQEFAHFGTVPRAGLRVDATHGARFSWMIRDYYSWTSFSGDTLGPDLMGASLYWGPNGLIRGDDLGRRIAAWSGSKPNYRERGQQESEKVDPRSMAGTWAGTGRANGTRIDKVRFRADGSLDWHTRFIMPNSTSETTMRGTWELSYDVLNLNVRTEPEDKGASPQLLTENWIVFVSWADYVKCLFEKVKDAPTSNDKPLLKCNSVA